MDIIAFLSAFILGMWALALLINWIIRQLERPYRTPCTEPGGRMHQWSSPVFRCRVCDHCRRREVLLRAWEFDGYDRHA